MRSWVFITCSAVSGEETTMVETSPRRRCIKGPCFLAKFVKVWWVSDELISWCMFPMRGSCHGPGGSFEVERLGVVVLIKILSTMKMKSRKAKRRDGDEN
ncbi:unnamed protein product [Camellia sinensis]